MLADFLAYVWPALPMFFFAGLCFLLAGALWLFVIRRHELAMGSDPAVPAVVEPATVVLPLPPKAHAARELPPWAPLDMYRDDSDTHVIARIPGATPSVVDEQSVDELLVGGLRELPAGPELARFLDAMDADVRVLDAAAGPTCTACGGPFGNCACYGQKSAPTEERTQVVDLCPLTTQDIEIPTDPSPPHFAETFTRHPRAELGTQELSGSLARAKESAA